MKKSDSIAILVLGEIVAISLIPLLLDVGLTARLKAQFGMNPVFVLPVFVPIAAFLALWVAFFIGQKLPFIFQVGKFTAVGIANTTIDFGVFSLLKSVTGVTSGLILPGINVPGFSVAVVNSYLWNKYWTFGQKETRQIPGEFIQFLVISIIGIMINSALIYIITTIIKPQFGIDPNLWATLAKGIATPVSMGWNFAGYKFIVFKKRVATV